MVISTIHKGTTNSGTIKIHSVDVLSSETSSTNSIAIKTAQCEISELNFAAAHSGNYRVEVSGWDAKENFFVEKTYLQWKERAGKTIAIHSQVRADCVLFVRLLRPLGGGGGFPVPYRAVNVTPSAIDAGEIVSLEQLKPRIPREDAASDMQEPSLGGSA